jgi:hypothetical protein
MTASFSDPVRVGAAVSGAEPERVRAGRLLHVGLTYRHLVIVGSVGFVLPNALIAAAFSPVAAALVMLGCAGSLLVIARESRAEFLADRIDLATFGLCFLTALALCILGGEGHVLYSNYDWLTRDAVLADLVRDGFPPHYEYQGTEYVLRAPLGMYMVPAAVGRLLGLHAAHVALLVQNTTLLALMLALLGRVGPRRTALFLAVFIAFSGADIIGQFVRMGMTSAIQGTALAWPLHVHQHLGWWNPLLQYTSHVAQIFWVPNHSFPGWWLAAMSILHARRAVGSGTLIVAFAFLVLWSPLTMAGAVPIVAYLVLRRDFAALLTPRLLVPVVAALCFLPVAAYLGADAATVPHGWLVLTEGFLTLYPIFLLIQIPHAGVVKAFWPRVDPDLRPLLVLAIALLVLIPIYRLGHNNDLAMRASIMPLALLAFAFGSIVAGLQWRDGVARIAPVVAIVVLGAFTPVFEIQRALMLKPFAISNCNLITTWYHLEPDTWTANYLARADRIPAWLIARDAAAMPMKIEDRNCWPDHPLNDKLMKSWRGSDTW